MSVNFSAVAEKYRDELLNNVIPFREKHSIDREFLEEIISRCTGDLMDVFIYRGDYSRCGRRWSN
jgi:hypothetical protein